MRVPSQHDTSSDGQNASSSSFTSFGHLTRSQSRPIAAKHLHNNSGAHNSCSVPENPDPETCSSPPFDPSILSGSLSTSPPVFVSPPHRHPRSSSDRDSANRLSMTSTSSSTGAESRPPAVSEPPGLEFALPLLPGEYVAFLGATRDADLQLTLTNYRFAVTALNSFPPAQCPSPVAAAASSASAAPAATPTTATATATAQAQCGAAVGAKPTAATRTSDSASASASSAVVNGGAGHHSNGLLGPLARNGGGGSSSGAPSASGVGMGLAIVPLGLIEQCNTDVANSLLVVNCRDLRIIKYAYATPSLPASFGFSLVSFCFSLVSFAFVSYSRTSGLSVRIAFGLAVAVCDKSLRNR